MILTDEQLKLRDSLYAKNSIVCEDCFLGYLVWKEKYGLTEKIINGTSVILTSKNSVYSFPTLQDESSLVNVVNELTALDGFCFDRISLEQKTLLEKAFPGRFDFREERGMFDYVYDIDSLCTVAGSKLSKKRNHINAFLSIYNDWKIKEIDESNLNEVLDFARVWYERKTGGDTEMGDLSLGYERDSLLKLVPHLKEIGAEGVALYVEGKIVAFTVGQRLSERAYDTVFEKADDTVRGAYNMINREFARYLKQKYPELKLINRENDLDLPGLRKAKLSYMPSLVVEKYSAHLK